MSGPYTHRDIKQLEQQVSESDLVDMEIESKENMISIAGGSITTMCMHVRT